jgi:hypothetical protein
VLFPRLDEAQRKRIAARARRRSFVPGATMFKQGTRDAPFRDRAGSVGFYQ